uniref:F-box associated beta-propeller type 1 domain-containing protein n=1 Tax=Brassica oleracea var. oleracea TaxID=109376 RepID=A0A0D3CE89_BRAOL
MFWDCDELYDGQVDGFKVYDFNSNAWRVVSYPNCFIMNSHGVNVKGNGYWNAYDDNYVDYILSFDFTGGRFIRLCLPPPSQGCMYTSLSVVREELLVLRCVKGSPKIEMWVTTNKMDTSASELSWSKSFTMNFGFPVIVYTSLLVDEDKKVVMCDKIVGDHLSGAFTIGEEDKYYSEIAFEGMSI